MAHTPRRKGRAVWFCKERLESLGLMLETYGNGVLLRLPAKGVSGGFCVSGRGQLELFDSFGGLCCNQQYECGRADKVITG